MNEEQKLDFVKSVFNRYISQIETLAKFKTFISNITPMKVRNAIKIELQKDIDTHSGYLVDEQDKVTQLDQFKNEIDNL